MDGEEVFLIVLFMVGVTVLAYPLVRALADRIRPRMDSGVKEELQGLREDLLTELRDMRGEVTDVGERVDFAERLLAKQRDAGRIGDGR